MTTDSTHWKEKAEENQCALCRLRARKTRGPKAMWNAVRSALNVLAYTGNMKPLSIPNFRIKGRAYELINEIIFTWGLSMSTVEGIVYAVTQATMDVCYSGDIDDIDLEMGKHYGFEESRQRGASPNVDAPVAGPSNAAEPSPPGEPSMEENA